LTDSEWTNIAARSAMTATATHRSGCRTGTTVNSSAGGLAAPVVSVEEQVIS
jgi:hypothetical protein